MGADGGSRRHLRRDRLVRHGLRHRQPRQGADNGNDLPEVYTTGERDVTRSYSFSVGESDFKRLDAMCNAHPYGWVREPDGERAFGIVSVSSSRSAPGWRSVSLKFTDCSWREPNVG